MSSDARAISIFHTQCWLDSYAGIVSEDYLNAIDVLEREASWRDRLSSKLSDTVLALSGDDIIGLVSWGRTD